MMVIELRKAAKDKVFDLFGEIEDLGRKKKQYMHELKETLYECFESSEDEYEDDEYEDMYGERESYEADFRNKSYRSGMHKGSQNSEMSGMRMRSGRGVRSRRYA
jgi:hypothetical protein